MQVGTLTEGDIRGSHGICRHTVYRGVTLVAEEELRVVEKEELRVAESS